MTEPAPPRAPDPPLVDPETGETPPLSPQTASLRLRYLEKLRADPKRFRTFVEGHWDIQIDERLTPEPDDAA